MKSINVGETIRLETYELRGNFEVVAKYKDSFGLDVLRIRIENDRLGGYKYFEILQGDK